MFFTALEMSTSFAQIWDDFSVGRTLHSDVPLGVSLSTVELKPHLKRIPSTCAAQTTVNLTPQVITKSSQTIEHVADRRRPKTQNTNQHNDSMSMSLASPCVSESSDKFADLV
jgi:hypothetical protein